MKVIIADYDEEAIRLFEEQCKQFSYVELSGKFNDSAETLKYVSRHRVEAAFINIELNGMDGLQLGEKLRELNPKIVLVFFIEHTEYILEALRIKSGWLYDQAVYYGRFNMDYGKCKTSQSATEEAGIY